MVYFETLLTHSLRGNQDNSNVLKESEFQWPLNGNDANIIITILHKQR